MLESYFYLIKKSWFYLKDYRSKFVKAYSLFILSAIIEFNKPIFIALAISGFEKQIDKPVQNAIFWLIIYFVSQIIVWLFFHPAAIEERKLAFKLGKIYRENIFQTLISRPLSWHKNFNSGQLTDRAKKSSDAIQQFFYDGFEILRVITIFLISLVVIIYFTKLIGLVIVSFSILILYISNYFDRQMHTESCKVNDKNHSMSGYFQDYLGNLITIISLKLQSFTKKKVSTEINNIYPPFYKKFIISQKKWFTTDMSIHLVTSATIITYILINYGTPAFSIAALAALIGYTFNLTEAIYSFAYQYQNTIEQHADLLSGEKLLEEKVKEKLTSKKPKQIKFKTIKIENLNFTYKDETKKIKHLNNVNFEIRPGQRIALTGKSGSGKSTFLKILGGLEWTKNATIKIDDKSFSNTLVLDGISTLIPQDSEIFNNTIGYNIHLGKNVSKEKLEKFIKITNFAEVLKKLPNGLETHIKEKGVNLSGGQKQRLALTRGLLAAEKSKIILLDEPTSSLDIENEIEIYKKIFKNFKDSCIISSVHKPYLLDLFDKKYHFTNGKIKSE